MTIRGISFELDSSLSEDFLVELFGLINASQFYWHVIQAQTEALDGLFQNDLFSKGYYRGLDLPNCNFKDSNIIFLKLQGYAYKCISNSIHTYADFQQSNCQLLLLIYDCRNLELYSKDIGIIQAIQSNLLKCGYEHFKIITDANDSRTKMDIL